jgi:SAM-dependent methyltransferase
MTLPRSYFDDMYAGSADPWGLATRWYEQRKYACSLAVLPKQTYRSGYEPGCSIGVLSAALAKRCDHLLCTDQMAEPLERASLRLAGLSHVEVGSQQVPREWPDGRFDLIVVSELAYYLDTADRELLWSRVAATLEPGGTLLAVHWRQAVPEYPCDGDQVHAELDRHPALRSVARQWDPDFRLDIYQPAASTVYSVAQREGLR